MDVERILDWCLTRLEGTVLVQSWGETGIFYNPGQALKRGVYVLTIKQRDGANDKSSRLDREGVYRVNLGLRRGTFQALFGPLPKRPPAGGVVELDVDFTRTNVLLPHPVYAWMGWVCALNPTEETFEQIKPLIQESYQYAKEKFGRRMRQKAKQTLENEI